MSCFFQRIYTEWNALKSSDPGSEQCSAEARAPGARSQMSKAEQRAYASLDMASAALMYAICRSDLNKTQTDLALTDEVFAQLKIDLKILHSQTSNKMSADTALCQTDPADWQREDWKACREQYITLLAEWSQMHDNHEPWPHGPPGACQACAKIDNANTEHQHVYCGKLFPRNIIPAGGDITEDPHRKELYRLWLARNCMFINNYVPLLMLLLQNNMDCQACTSKAGVIEYMTKYMTKTGSGSLLNIMETSFAKCMEKALSEDKGPKAAISKFLNVVAASDVKCQGETFHMVFDMPRVLCSRDFTRLSLQPLLKRLRAPEEIHEENASVLAPTALDRYSQRQKYQTPTADEWQQTMPNSKLPLWKFANLRKKAASDCSTQEELLTPEIIYSHLEKDERLRAAHWKTFVKSLSLWEFVRFFQVSDDGRKLKLKKKASVLILTRKPLLHRYFEGVEYKNACVNAVLAYMNWGPDCNIQNAVTFISLL